MPNQNLTDDEFIRQMTVGTLPENQAPSESFIGKRLAELGISPADFLLMAGKVPSAIGLALTPTPAGAGEEEELARLRGLTAQETATTEGGAAKAMLQAIKSKNPAVAAKAISEAPQVFDIKKSGKLSELEKELIEASGKRQALRLQRAADEIPGLEDQYQVQALRRAFLGRRGYPYQALMTLDPKDFQELAFPLGSPLNTYSKRNIEKLRDVLRQGGSFDEVPFLMIDKKDDFPSIVHHEGRHRTRALAAEKAPKTLVELYPRRGLEMGADDEYMTATEWLKRFNEELAKRDRFVFSEDEKNVLKLPEAYAEGGEVTDEEKEARTDKYRAEAASEALMNLINNYRMTGRGAEDIARVTGLPVADISKMFGASDTSLPSAELAQESRLGEFRETTPKVMTDEGTRLSPGYELRSVPKDLTAPIGKESLEDYIRRYNIQRSGVNPRTQMFAEGGEVTNEDFIQQMITGTPPTDQEPRPYDQTAVAQFADYLRAPVDLAQTAVRGTVGAVVGPAYGVYKGLTGGKYGTPEGVREASEAGGQLMQRITGEPQSQAAKDVLEFIGKKAEEYKLAPTPQLMTLPVPGPGAAQYPLQAAKTQAEDIALRAVRSQTENPDITAAQLYNAMLGKQAPGAAITKPMGPTTAPVQAPQTPLGFYSAVEDTVLKLPQEKGTAQQLLAQISKAPGVKTKEVEATGLAEFLRSKGAAPVTKQEIQDFLANNRVQVDEVVLGKGQVISPEAKRRMVEAENRMIELDEKLASHPFFSAPIPASALSDVLELERNILLYDLRGPVARKAAQGDPDALAKMEQAGLPPDLKQMLLEFGEQKNEYQKYAKQSRRIEKPKFDKYNIPGGENAREIYLTLPRKPVAPVAGGKSPATMLFEREMMEKYGTDNFPSTYNRLSPDEVDKYEMYVREDRNAAKTESILRDRQTNYTVPPSHGVSPEADTNRLAHIFLDDRTDAQGNKTLFVQELQSDWGQEGKKKGFYDQAPPDRRDDPEWVALDNRRRDLYNEFNANSGNRELQERLRPEMDRLGQQLAVLNRRYDEEFNKVKGKLPPAPFVMNTEDWLNLALKRVIKEAVDSGADNVAFIKGEQAADKYSLRKVVDEIRYGDDGYLVAMKNGAIISSRKVPKEELPDHVGKEVADRLLNNPTEITGSGYAVVSGVDLQVGGEGMKGFYDNIVPKTANKLLEKLGGGKVGPIDIGGSSEKSFGVSFDTASNKWEANLDNKPIGSFATKEEAQAAAQAAYDKDKISYLGFKITPEMREIVKGQGLPQFAAGGEVTNFIRAHA